MSNCEPINTALPCVPELTFFALSCPGGAGGAAGVSSLNSMTGVLNVVGVGNISVSSDGISQIFVSGSNAGGAVTQSQLDSLSGWAASSTGLSATGHNLYVLVTGLSGSNNSTFATIVNLTQTGVILGGQINALSGFSTGFSGYLWNQIALTGQQAWTAANNNAVNLSGNLTASGALLSAVKVTGSNIINVANFTGISGTTVVYSGGFIFISSPTGVGGGSSAGVSSLNSLVGAVNVSGTGGLTVLNVGQNIFISGDQSISGALTQTGIQALAYANGIGTIISGNLTQTGVQALAYAQGIGSIISGNLTTTGTLLSAVKVSGSAIINVANFTGIDGDSVVYSGGTIFVSGAGIRIGLTGQQALSFATSMGTILSGNDTQTGIQALAYAAGIGSIISGNLTQTGTQLSAVKVTGSSVINIANITGISGTTVVYSGGFIFISSPTGFAGGGAGGGVTSLNALTNAVVVSGTGGLTVLVNGQNILISGDQTISGYVASVSGVLAAQISASNAGVGSLNGLTGALNIIGTGGTISVIPSGVGTIYIAVTGIANLPSITSLSGNMTQTGVQALAYAQGIGSIISGNLTQTGIQALAFANGIGTIISGNLTQTGVQALAYAAGIGSIISGNLTTTGTLLSAVKVSGSAIINNANFTGIDGTSVVYSGGTIFVSGNGTYLTLTGQQAINFANGIGVNLSGNLTQTGIQAFAFANGIGTIISGNLTQTGIQALAYAQGIGSIISGNLTQTGVQALAYAAGIGSIISGNLTTTGTLLSAVKVTGSAVINVANFTGISGTTVVYSGGFIFICSPTGTAGGGGGGVTSVNSLAGAVLVSGTGGLTVLVNGQNILISGDQSISGYVAGVSGVLAAQISASNAGVGSLNGLTGALNIIGTGGTISVVPSGVGTIYIAVTGIASLPSITSLSGNMTQTGVQALAYAQGIGSIISGNLTQTGIQALAFAQGIGSIISGNLTTTGTLLSAVKVSGSAIINNANFTGIDGTSVVYSGATIFVSGNGISLALTGQQAWTAADANGRNISGNLTQTGIQALAYAQGIGSIISGNLTQTGIQALAYAAGIGSIISGNLTQTGVTLGAKIDSSSGYAEGIYVHRTGDEFITGIKNFMAELRFSSGMKVPERLFGSANYTIGSGDYIVVATGAVANVTGILPVISIPTYSGALFTIINSRTIPLTISGIVGGVTNPILLPFDAIEIYGGSGVWHNIGATGSQIWFDQNANAVALSGNMTQTGIQALAYAAGIGSIISGNLTQTGIQALAYAQGIGSIISGNLTQTGIQAFAFANGIGTIISGNLTTTGTLLSAVKVTGSAIINVANFTGISGTTVVYSGGTIFISSPNEGAEVTSLNGLTNAVNISGTGGFTVLNVGQTIFISGDQSISGFVTGVSGALQAQIAGGGAQIRVTGSANMSIADFTGIGGLIVYTTGTTVVISGGGGTAGGGGVTTLNGLSSAVSISGTGGLTVMSVGQTIFISGDQSISGALTQTGIQALAYAQGIGSIISGNLTQTGIQALAFANGIGTIISGNLITTGTQLSAINVTGSPILNRFQLSGLAGTIVTYSGTGWVLISGNAPLLQATGQQALSFATSMGTIISGNMTQTGIQSFAFANGIGTIISGNLTNTGTQLSAVNITGSPILNRFQLSGLGGTLVTYSGTGWVLISGNDAKLNAVSGALFTLIGLTGTRVTVTGSTALGTADLTGIGGLIVYTSGTTVYFSGGGGGGGGGTPGGANTQVQFNDSSTFNGDAGLTYAKSTQILTVSGSLVLGSGIISSPVFTFSTGNGLSLSGGLNFDLQTTSTSLTLIGTQCVVVATTGLPFTYTLPNATIQSGRMYMIKNKALTGVLTIDGTALGGIDGGSVLTLSSGQAAMVVSDGTTWNIF